MFILLVLKSWKKQAITLFAGAVDAFIFIFRFLDDKYQQSWLFSF